MWQGGHLGTESVDRAEEVMGKDVARHRRRAMLDVITAASAVLSRLALQEVGDQDRAPLRGPAAWGPARSAQQLLPQEPSPAGVARGPLQQRPSPGRCSPLLAAHVCRGGI
jgi:hypothetical protein